MPNKKNIEQVKRLSESFSKAKAVYFTEFHGLNVGEITKLRSEFFKADVEFKVAKNTLVKLAAKDNNVPFYVALPSSTIDWNIKDHKKIPIEERNSEELSHVEGIDKNNQVTKVRIYPKKSKSMNLAFDVTPAKYVTGLITEKGICEASEKGLKGLFK